MKRAKILLSVATIAILALAFACSDPADDGGAASPDGGAAAGGANDGGSGGDGPAPDADAPTAGDGGFGEASQNAICARCDQLLQEIEAKRQRRINELLGGAGCSLGSGSTGFGGTSNWQDLDFDWNCPNQSASEALGEAFADAKANRSALDREIDELQAEYDANCPCMQVVHQCVVCAGVPVGGLCPTYFVISKQECDDLSGEFIENTEALGGGSGSP